MDIIRITGLPCFGRHGFYDRERQVEQEFIVSVEISLSLTRAAKSDKLEDTLDYDALKSRISAIIHNGSYYLIEKLSSEIADKILEDLRVQRVVVTVQKPAVWDRGIPSVTLRRTRRSG